MSQVHPYRISLEWSGGREGSGRVRGEGSRTDFSIAAPAEFGGTGKGTNPEELLTAAIAACYTMTFGIIAANRKIPVLNVEATAEGEVEQSGMQFTYRSIVVRPSITLEAGASDEQAALAEDMAHKADHYCIITNAVRDKVSITVEPTIIRG